MTDSEMNSNRSINRNTEIALRLIGACPSKTAQLSGTAYLESVKQTARYADEAGWEAVLIYTDHRQIDPWLLAQHIVQHSSRLRPLVAVQPAYAHPFTVAKATWSIAALYGRQVYLNMVAGDFPRDRGSLYDDLSHDDRYERLVEYASVVKAVFQDKRPTTFVGRYYRVKDLQLASPVAPELFPEITVSGSSPAGLAAARRLSGRAIHYLRPPGEYADDAFNPQLQDGVRLGIIVRETADEAWRKAYQRFPASANGAALRDFASSVSDSSWVKDLSTRADQQSGDDPYWLSPYKHAQTSCPYLVGSMTSVADRLARCIQVGLRTFLLDLPEDAEDSRRIAAVFELARTRARELLLRG